MQRRQRSVQHVIHAVVAACALHSFDVRWFLDHAHQALIARWTSAVRTRIHIGNVVADRAEAQVFLEPAHGLGQRRRVFAGRAQNVEGKPLSGFCTDPGSFSVLQSAAGHWLGIPVTLCCLPMNGLCFHLCGLKSLRPNAGRKDWWHLALLGSPTATRFDRRFR